MKDGTCRHGERPIVIKGCASCAISAMNGLNLLRALDANAHEVLEVLSLHYKTDQQIREAISSARERIESREAVAEEAAQALAARRTGAGR